MGFVIVLGRETLQVSALTYSITETATAKTTAGAAVIEVTTGIATENPTFIAPGPMPPEKPLFGPSPSSVREYSVGFKFQQLYLHHHPCKLLAQWACTSTKIWESPPGLEDVSDFCAYENLVARDV